METRVCKKCREEKPITLFRKSKECIGGYSRICKTCNNARHQLKKKYSPGWFEYHQLLEQGLKKCTKCGEILGLDEFYPRRCTGSAIKVSSTCKKCTNMISNNWKRENRAKMNEYNKHWIRRNPAKARAYRHREYERHIEEYKQRGLDYREEHKDEIKKYLHEYNKKKRRENNRNYIEKKVATTLRFRKNVGRSYAAQILKNAYGLSLEEAYKNPELIALKQIQIKLKRLTHEKCKRTAQ